MSEAEGAERRADADTSAPSGHEADASRTSADAVGGDAPAAELPRKQHPPRVPKAPIGHRRIPGWGQPLVVSLALAAAALLAVATNVGTGLLVVAAAIVAGVVIYGWSRIVENRRTALDRAITYCVTAAFAVAVAPLVSVLWTVVTKGSNRFDPQFFTESMRNVVGEGGGAQQAIVGTLVVTAVASVAAVPIGVLAAVYLVEYGKGRLKRALTFFVDVMTGIPSIVAGLFAFALFRLFFGPGVRMGVMGAVALTVLMIPIVVRATEEMLKVVPASLREASYALGVPKWRTVTKVVLPTALGGIVTGVMLAVARIIGETAPLLITTGTFSSVNWNPFAGRMDTLPVFSYSSYRNPGVPPDPSFDRAWSAALTLILIVMILNLTARVVSRLWGARTR